VTVSQASGHVDGYIMKVQNVNLGILWLSCTITGAVGCGAQISESLANATDSGSGEDGGAWVPVDVALDAGCETLLASSGVGCVVVAFLPAGSQADCSTLPGMTQPNPSSLEELERAAHAAWVEGGAVGVDSATLPICQVNYLGSSMDCSAASSPGWCYAISARECADSIMFSNGTIPVGSAMQVSCPGN
jgi:hypothetical protein